MKAMVFAAGLGTRLRPITDSLPKALVPVGGEPLLHHVLVKLRDSGYDEVVVNVHHFAPMVRQYLAAHDFGLKVDVSDESDGLLETGGAILHARRFLEDAGEPFLVHNVDILSDLSLPWLRSNTPVNALATLLVSERETQRYLLFDEDMNLVGWTNIATGEVRSPFPRLDVTRCRRYAFSGIHNISPLIFGAFEDLGFSGRFPIIDFYLQACGKYRIRGVVPGQVRLVDVGKLDTLAEAERIFANFAL